MMDTEKTTSEVTVPVKVPQPVDDAPPTLAEPASGPVAEMSGAVANADAHNINGTVAASTSAPTHLPTPPAAHPTETESAPAPPTGQDTEMKDSTEAPSAPADGDEAALEANGTPAGRKSSNNNSRRKSVGGVPEHKNKKLNKKKSIAKITHLDVKPGELYFARLKSYPPWPSIVCDEEMLPQTLLSSRPVTTMRKDGTYNEAYAEGGKKVTERTYPVMFLYTNEFAWIPNTDLTPLTPEECKDVSEKGKSKSLIAAYQVATEGHDLQFYKDMLIDHARALQEDEELKEAKAAEKAAAKAEKAAEKAATKKKRKSEIKAQADDVEMEDADGEEVKKSSKKRKKGVESDDEETEKPAKTPKTTKLKLTTNKTPATAEKKAKEKTAKPKSEKKSKPATSDEEMADAPEVEEEEPLDPVEARKAREKEVLFLRHKLQKGFLTRDQAPQEEEMPQMSNYVKKLENYGELEVSIIRNTKINKVLKALVKLNTIPKDEEFGFRKRSMELLSKWNKALGAEPAESADAEASASASADKDSKSTPTTNGIHEEKSEEKSEEKKGEESTPADKPLELAEMPSIKAHSDPTKAEIAEPKQSTVDHTAGPSSIVPSKPEVAVIDKVPESAAAAAEITEVVKAAE